jgi:phytoene dehydrogenase-like protein
MIHRSPSKARSYRILDTSRASPLKGFTDTLPEIKAMLRVCAFHLYGWACEHPSVADQADKVRAGWVPDGYPKSWPSAAQPALAPPGTAPFSDRIEREIAKRMQRIKASVEDLRLAHYPRAEVLEVLRFWGVELEK